MTIPRTIPGPGSRGRIIAAVLAGVVAILAAVTIALYLTQRAPSSAPAPAPPPAESTPAAATPSPDVQVAETEEDHNDDHSHDHDHDVADEDKASWEPVVLGFAKNFTDTSGGPARWRTRLSPYVVPAVEDQLATVDLDKVPAGRFDSYEVLTPGSYQIAVKVTYREGWALVLYLTTDGAAWSITNYDRFVE